MKTTWRKHEYAGDTWYELVDVDDRVVGRIDLPTWAWQTSYPAYAISSQHVTPQIVGTFTTAGAAKRAVEKALARFRSDHE